jgi:hypothetical protein
MPLEKIFKPLKKYKLNRIGGTHDGGYLIGENSLKKSETLISFGINDDWRFEKEFKTYNINCKIQCYDDKPILKYLIHKFLSEIIFLPHHRRSCFIKYFKNIFDFLKIRKKINFIQRKIFYGDLNLILSNIRNDNIFLKIDIEGSEYRILNEIIENQKRIIGIAIEFHDVDYHRNRIIDFCKKLDLKLIHIHPNNFAPKDRNCDPTILELTFERNPILEEKEEWENDDLIFPHKLDMKNYPLGEDIDLIFER